MRADPLDPVKVQELLAGSLARLQALAGAASPGALEAVPSPGEWSAVEVLAHLRACADVWGGCIERILVEDEPTIRAVNPRAWLRGKDYAELAFGVSFEAFRTQRASLLERLASLTPEEWSRAATIRGAGKPLTRTVLGYALWLAEHERPHVRQAERAVSPGGRVAGHAGGA